jgi:hypothetical protein
MEEEEWHEGKPVISVWRVLLYGESRRGGERVKGGRSRPGGTSVSTGEATGSRYGIETDRLVGDNHSDWKCEGLWAAREDRQKDCERQATALFRCCVW